MLVCWRHRRLILWGRPCFECARERMLVQQQAREEELAQWKAKAKPGKRRVRATGGESM